MHPLDGNMAALRQYEKEQDDLDAADEALEQAKQALADDLFDAYFSNNHEVIAEIDDTLVDSDWTDLMLERLRKAMMRECEGWIGRRGPKMYTTYQDIISAACEHNVERLEDMESVQAYRMEFKL